MSRREAAPAIGRAVPVFAALGDATRLGIVARLSAEGPLSITRLASGSRVTRQAVTKHLEVLAGAGLVRDAWSGRERVFELEPRPLAEARRQLDAISKRWDDAIERLRAKVER
jgi:DNA-binding transcriptional ArsR family regulator